MPSSAPSTLTLPEAIIGLAVLIVAVFAWMALLLLDNHVGTLAGVCLAAAGALVVLLAVAMLLSPRPKISADPWTLAVLGILAALGGFLFFPGFSYGVTDKDPGAYVAMGAAFGRSHSYSFTDVLGQHVSGLVQASPGARFPAVWLLPHSSTVVMQFYHLWPALLAMAYDIGGLRLEVQVAPLMGVLAVCVFALLLRRAVPGRASLPAAAIGGLLLELNMMEVWQAKYPSTEILAQLLFVSVLLAVCVSLQTGWRPAAGAGGLLLGIGWLERPDMLLLVGIAVAAGAVLIALRRFDARAWWFTAGFAVVLPHAAWQAYAGARQYTLENGVPKLTTLIAATLALVGLALAVRAAGALPRRALAFLSARRPQFWIGFGVCAVVAGLIVFGFLRPRLLGADTQNIGTSVVRTYNEQNMHRLSWFLTLAAFPIAVLGLAVVALRRWRAALWAAVLPALIVAPIYIAKDRVASRLMWSTRRFVPEVLPEIVLLTATALATALVWRFRRRRVLALPVLGIVALLLVTFVHQSAPLRHHNEYAGSFDVTAQMARVAGPATGVYLFGQRTCCTSPGFLFGAALWLERGQYDALMPPGSAAGPYVRHVVASMPGHPVFIVWTGTDQPALGPLQLKAVSHITASLPMWEESDTSRPNKEGPPIPVNLTIWRVAGT
jgi:hypothetical protein